MRGLVPVAIAVILLVSIQLLPVSKTNPPVSQDLGAPAAVESMLHRGCYDCHSNQTRWPWYAQVAPISWMLARDVRAGRKHLNFSTWDAYGGDPGTVAGKLKKIGKVTKNGSMPFWYYTVIHPAARLTHADRMLIADWAERAAAKEESVGDPASR